MVFSNLNLSPPVGICPPHRKFVATPLAVDAAVDEQGEVSVGYGVYACDGLQDTVAKFRKLGGKVRFTEN